VASALLLDLGFVIVDVTPEATRAYQRATGTSLPGLDEAAAKRDWGEAARRAGHGDMVGLFRALIAAVPEMLFLPDAVALIEDVHAGGLPVGVLTNHAYTIAEPDWYARRPELAPLRMFIDAAEIGYPKPHPNGYLIAAEQLGVPPTEIVFLDDTPECIDGALAVGMTAIVVDPDDRQPAFDAARRLLGINRDLGGRGIIP
jgi:FMN phosphatase YigB (HAD superfamily)